jgi:transcriptional regulator GlxA family with amidase domain
LTLTGSSTQSPNIRNKVCNVTTETRTISIVLLPRFNMMTLTTVVEPMRIANYLSSEDLFTWEYYSPEPGNLIASNGMSCHCSPLPRIGSDAEKAVDVIAVFGSWGAESYEHAELNSLLKHQARRRVTLIGVELGAYALARAGVLYKSHVTTHWCWKSGFEERFPRLNVCEQLYCIDRNIVTCAGGTAGLDMMLQLISNLYSEQLAVEISNQLLLFPWRPPESPQRAAAGSICKDIHPNVREAMRLLEQNVEEPCSIPDLCKQLNVSQRSLERLFVRDTGCTIVQFSKLLRLQFARVLLASTQMSVREVSVACGFNSLSYFSQCFSRLFRKRPSDYRQAWPDNEPAPSWPGTAYSFIEQSVGTETEVNPTGVSSPALSL